MRLHLPSRLFMRAPPVVISELVPGYIFARPLASKTSRRPGGLGGESYRMPMVDEDKLGGGFEICFLFSPRKLGKSSNLTHIFQMG